MRLLALALVLSGCLAGNAKADWVGKYCATNCVERKGVGDRCPERVELESGRTAGSWTMDGDYAFGSTVYTYYYLAPDSCKVTQRDTL